MADGAGWWWGRGATSARMAREGLSGLSEVESCELRPYNEQQALAVPRVWGGTFQVEGTASVKAQR